MNGAIAALLHTDIRPLFYVSTDRGFCREQPALYRAAIARAQNLALWPDQIAELEPAYTERAYPLRKAPATGVRHLFGQDRELATRARNVLSKRARSIGFSKDMGYGFFDARTIAYVCLQLAYHLGFDQIFMVGVDLNGKAQRFYDASVPAPSPCGLDDYFHSRILPSFKVLKRALSTSGRQVMNLSGVSKLPGSLIQRADLSALRCASASAINCSSMKSGE